MLADRADAPRPLDRADSPRAKRGDDQRAQGAAANRHDPAQHAARSRKDGVQEAGSRQADTDVLRSDKADTGSDTAAKQAATIESQTDTPIDTLAPAPTEATADVAVAVEPVAVAVIAPVAIPMTTPGLPENTGAPQAPLAIAAAAALKARAAGSEIAEEMIAVTTDPVASAADEQEFAALIAAAMPAEKPSGKKAEAAPTATPVASVADKAASAPELPAAPATDEAIVPAGETSAAKAPVAAAETDITAAKAAPKVAQHAETPTQAAAPDTAQPIASNLSQPQQFASAVAAAQLTATPATGAPVPLKDLAVEIAVTAQAGISRFNIRLDPAELGRIDVRMDVDQDGKVTSHLTVEKPETLAMLRQDAPLLQRALEQAGLKTSDNGLQFSLRDEQSSDQKNNNDQEPGRQAQRLVISDEEIIPAAAAGRGYGRMLGLNSGVDIRI
jgi:chemotaxis protein MotD